MSNVMRPNVKPALNRAGVNRLMQVFGSIAIMGAILFVSAGSIAWLNAWAFLGISLAAISIGGLWVLRKNPDVINERGRMAENTKSWDKVIGALYMVMLLALFVVAGLDAARFAWSTMPISVSIVGVIGFGLAMLLIYWTMLGNPYLSTFVRIQDDRGHRAVTTGPYRLVRHPMYVGIILYTLCISLILGSWYSLIPGGLIVIIFIVRTALEDQTLKQELPGYREYAERVRYRLVPGIW